MTLAQEDFPPYRVRVSSRARHVRFAISARFGFEVVVPSGYDMRGLDGLLRSRQKWILEHWNRLCAPGAAPDACQKRGEREQRRPAWPACMDLLGTGEHFGIRYKLGARAGVREQPGVLMVRHVTPEWSAARTLLENFLKRHAARRLTPLLAELAERHRLPKATVSIRFQRTRWGSCSSRGNINLNICILFLPPRLVEYLLLHELCHRLHLDHSPRFWTLLETVLPDALALDHQISSAWRYVPRWLCVK